jgi:hypothetical protein
MPAKKKPESYKVLTDWITVPTPDGEVRFEQGSVCDCIPAKSVAWLESQGLIEAVGTKSADPVEED